jgi:hypothetical protein
VNLSTQAKNALDRVVNAQVSYRIAREGFERELQAELQEKLKEFVEQRNRAVIMADKAGVPRTQIGKAMGTTNYRTVQEILEEAAESEDFVAGESDNWAIAKAENGYELSIIELGAGAVSGTAIVRVNDGELEFVQGDPFVVPQVYRNNIAADIIGAIE